jgi:cysteine desulfurase/selenocysteine lyase
VEGVHPFDLATMVDKIGIALRSGNQCAQPLLYEAYGIGNITRMSPAFYNTYDEIDVAASALKRVIDLLRSASVRSQ